MDQTVNEDGSFIPGNGTDSCNVRFRAVDRAGNKGPWTDTHHIHMDTQAPSQVPVINITNVSVNKDNWTYTISISGVSDNTGIAGYKLNIDGEITQITESTYTLEGTNTDFEYKISVQAYDYAGNNGLTSSEITISPIRLYIRQLYQELRGNNNVDEINEVGYWDAQWKGETLPNGSSPDSTYKGKAAYTAYGILGSEEASRLYISLGNRYDIIDILYKGILSRTASSSEKEESKA